MRTRSISAALDLSSVAIIITAIARRVLVIRAMSTKNKSFKALLANLVATLDFG
jgi:hypothetical protein